MKTYLNIYFCQHSLYKLNSNFYNHLQKIYKIIQKYIRLWMSYLITPKHKIEIFTKKFRNFICRSWIILAKCVFQLFNHTMSLKHRRGVLRMSRLAIFVYFSVVSSKGV
jgi:hypothetical protein